MSINLFVSAVIGCWFSSINSPSSHSEARLWDWGKRIKRTISLLSLFVPVAVLLVAVVLLLLATVLVLRILRDLVELLRAR